MKYMQQFGNRGTLKAALSDTLWASLSDPIIEDMEAQFNVLNLKSWGFRQSGWEYLRIRADLKAHLESRR